MFLKAAFLLGAAFKLMFSVGFEKLVGEGLAPPEICKEIR
jgi:hypothetical protein